MKTFNQFLHEINSLDSLTKDDLGLTEPTGYVQPQQYGAKPSESLKRELKRLYIQGGGQPNQPFDGASFARIMFKTYGKKTDEIIDSAVDNKIVIQTPDGKWIFSK